MLRYLVRWWHDLIWPVSHFELSVRPFVLPFFRIFQEKCYRNNIISKVHAFRSVCRSLKRIHYVIPGGWLGASKVDIWRAHLLDDLAKDTNIYTVIVERLRYVLGHNSSFYYAMFCCTLWFPMLSSYVHSSTRPSWPIKFWTPSQ